MLDGLTPDLAPRLVLAIGGVGIALVVLVLVLIFLKRRNSPLFIKGGKSREPRLLVLDAAAVDPKRRLVLIRRDDVEHLIMIGGPTDIVIESGIVERIKPDAVQTAGVEDLLAAQAVTTPVPDVRAARPTPPAERRPQPASPAPAAQAERRVAAPAVEARPSRPLAPVAEEPRKAAPVAERSVARGIPVPHRGIDAQQPDKDVSAAGAMLYGGDRGTKPAAVASRAPHVAHPHPAHAVAAGKREQSASAAEAALDAARNRVLPGQQTAASSQPVAAADDAEKAPAARLDTARMEAMRRVRSAQPAVALASSHSAAQPVAQKRDTAVQPPKTGDAEPSDFEKLLEAELDASGVFAGQAPQVQGDTRVTHAAATGGLAPPVRVTPPITGTTPDISSEEDVARLLGEIAVNRKP